LFDLDSETTAISPASCDLIILSNLHQPTIYVALVHNNLDSLWLKFSSQLAPLEDWKSDVMNSVFYLSKRDQSD
jgi:hypothetical protein